VRRSILVALVSVCLPVGGLAVERPLAEIVDEWYTFALEDSL